MKTFTLIIGMLCITTLAFPQACPTVTSHSIISSQAGNALTVSYTGNGSKHIEYYIYCDGEQMIHDCFDTHGDGTQTSEPITCSGVLTYILIPGTGTCINGTTCGDTIRSPEGGPTPVVLGNFTAQWKSNNVSLIWQTEQELNLNRFEVLRSTGNSPYSTIGKVNGHGTTSNFQSYSFIDNTNNSKSVSFYRLKMIDTDGKISYTDIRAVKGKGVKPNFVVFPNPSFGNARVTITDLHEPTSVEVVDNSGRIIRSITLTDKNYVEINGLQKGVYNIKINGKKSGESAVRTITVIE